MDLTLTQRNARVEDVIDLLNQQADVKYDVVVSSDRIRYAQGHVVIVDGAAVIDDNGVGTTDAFLSPTDVFEDGLSARLGIPRAYVRTLRDTERDHDGEDTPYLDVLDANVNLWLDHNQRNYMVRGFRVDDHRQVGIARAFLSDRFAVIDHIDAVMAVLDGIASTGLEGVTFDSADLSERTLRVKISAPEVTAVAREFLRGYRSPFTGATGDDLPVISAGLALSNSETGGGAFSISPQITVLVCNNGMTRKFEALRKVHVGGQLEEGVVAWSAETRSNALELVKSQAADAVRTFLSTDYIEGVAQELDAKAGAEVRNATDVLERVAKTMRYTEDEQKSILDFFVRGGQATAGGVMQAVTAYAQEVEDPDRAAELEEGAFDVLNATLAAVR